MINITPKLLAFLSVKPIFVDETGGGIPITPTQALWYLNHEKELEYEFGMKAGEIVRLHGYGDSFDEPTGWAGMNKEDMRTFDPQLEEGLTLDDLGEYSIELWPGVPMSLCVVYGEGTGNTDPVYLTHDNPIFMKSDAISILRGRCIADHATQSRIGVNRAVSRDEVIGILCERWKYRIVPVTAHTTLTVNAFTSV